VPYEAGRHLGVEDHRHLRSLHLPRAEPPHRAPRRGPADLFRRLEQRALTGDVVPGVPLHLAVRGRHRGDREAERGRLVLAPEAVTGGVGIARAPVAEVAALGVGDAGIGFERGRLAAAGQLDLLLGGEVVAARIAQVEVGHLPRQLRDLRQAAHLVRARDPREGHRFVHQPRYRLGREIGRGGGRHRLAHEDPQRHVLLAGVLDGVHLAQAHLGRERLVLHHEGVGGGGAPARRLLQEIGEQVAHAPQTWVPPTVIRSMRIVGSPTPTGTD